jgi:hypothetical protein
MSIFDIFSTGPSQQAAAAQTAGLNAGYNQASGNINQAIGALNQNYGQAGQQLQTNYTSALQPYLQNYGQAQGGVNQLENLLGINGAGGSAQAQQTLTNMPGYQFALQQGQNATNAAAQAGGTGQSGNQQLALQQQGQGLASQNYNQYVSQLQPFLGASNAAAGGINSTYTGLGQGLAANSQGLGQGLAGQYGNLANLGWQTQTGIGNANANADLSAYNASANILGALGGGIGGIAKLGVSGGGSLGGNFLNSLFSGGGSTGGGGGVGFAAEGGDIDADRPYVVGEPRGYAEKLRRFIDPNYDLGEAIGSGATHTLTPSERIQARFRFREPLAHDPDKPFFGLLRQMKRDLIPDLMDSGKDATYRAELERTFGVPARIEPHYADPDGNLYPGQMSFEHDNEHPKDLWNAPLFGFGDRTKTGYASGGDPPVGKPARVGERDPDWFGRLHARLQREADDAVAQRLDARTYEDMAGVDRPYKRTPERAPLSLRYPAFQDGGDPLVGDPAYVGEGAPPKPELFVPHDGSPPEWLGLDGPEVIVPQKPGTVVPNHALPYVSAMSKFMPPDLASARQSAASGLEAAGPYGMAPDPASGGAALRAIGSLPMDAAGFAERLIRQSGESIGDPQVSAIDPMDLGTAATLGMGDLPAVQRGVAKTLGELLTASPKATGVAAGLGAGIAATPTQTAAEDKPTAQQLQLEQYRQQMTPRPVDPEISEQIAQYNKIAEQATQAAQAAHYRLQGDKDRADAKAASDQAAALTKILLADQEKERQRVAAAEAAHDNLLKQIQQDALDEAKRLDNMPSQDRYPGWALGLRAFGAALAFAVPYARRNLQVRGANHVADEVSRLAGIGQKAIDDGDIDTLKHTAVALKDLRPRARQAEREWSRENLAPLRGPSANQSKQSNFMKEYVLPSALSGLSVSEFGALPSEYDWVTKQKGNVAHDEALSNILNPGRLAIDFGAGNLARGFGTELPTMFQRERPNMQDLAAIIKRATRRPSLDR